MQSLNPKFVKLITYLWSRGISAFIVIFGRRGTGKTDFSLLIAEVLKREGIVQHFGTNIKIYKSPFQIEHIDNLEDLKLWAQNYSGKKLFILDEAGRTLARRSPMSKINLEIIKQLQIIRKYKLSLILVTPNEKYLDSASLGSDVLDGVFRKTGFKIKKIVLYDDLLEGFRLNVYGIPRTSINFDTWDSADFTLKRQIINPLFSDQDHTLLWRYANSETIKQIGVHPEKFRRIVRKFLREHLKTHITSHITKSKG